jgi:hypothetical protein
MVQHSLKAVNITESGYRVHVIRQSEARPALAREAFALLDVVPGSLSGGGANSTRIPILDSFTCSTSGFGLLIQFGLLPGTMLKLRPAE